MKFGNGITLVAFADDDAIIKALTVAIQVIHEKRGKATQDRDILELRDAQHALERLLSEVAE